MTITPEELRQRSRVLSLGRARVWIDPDQRQDQDLTIDFSGKRVVLSHPVEPVTFTNVLSAFFRTVPDAEDILLTMINEAGIQIIAPPENTLDYNEVYLNKTIDIAYTLFCQIYPVYSQLYPQTWCNDGFYEMGYSFSWRFAKAAVAPTVRELVETAFGVYTKPLVRHVINNSHIAFCQAIIFNYLVPHEWIPNIQVSFFYGGEFLEKDLNNAKNTLTPSLVKRFHLREKNIDIDGVESGEFFSFSEIIKTISFLRTSRIDQKFSGIRSWSGYQNMLNILVMQEENGNKFNCSNFDPIAKIEVNGWLPTLVDTPTKLVAVGNKANNCLKETQNYLHKAYSGTYCYMTWGDVSLPEGIIAEVTLQSNSGYKVNQIFHRENQELEPLLKKEITDKIESLEGVKK